MVDGKYSWRMETKANKKIKSFFLNSNKHNLEFLQVF